MLIRAAPRPASAATTSNRTVRPPAARNASAIGIGRADIGQRAHAGGPRRLDAGQRILDHRAVEGLLVHLDGGVKEEIRERLAARHLARTEDAALEARPQAGDAERHAHLVEPARACDAGRDPRRLDRIDRLDDARHGLQRRVAEGLHRVGLQAVDEIGRQLAAEFALDDLDAGFHRAAHQAAHRLLDAPVESLALERAGEAGVGEGLAVDQHPVAIEYDQHAPRIISKACRLPP